MSDKSQTTIYKFQTKDTKIPTTNLFLICNLCIVWKLVLVFCVLSFWNLVFAKHSLAQAVIESNNYRIQMPNFNSGAGIPSSTNYKMDTTVGQTAAGLYTSNGYLVRSGFQYIHSIIPFSFSMSNFLINFGGVIPGSPVTVQSTLTVSSGGAGGYKILARESDYLKNSAGQTIPDTTCDSGGCSETTAAVWSLAGTYGFGYNMTGSDIPSDFVNSTYFRHFANASASQTDQVIMQSANVGRGATATITYKINISGVQPAGTYQNKILFTAVPSY